MIPRPPLKESHPAPRYRGLRGDYAPSTAFKKDEAENGIPVVFTSPVLTRVDSSLNFNWFHNSPLKEVLPQDDFQARWSGLLHALEPGVYYLGLASDDGTRLMLDGQPILDTWWPKGEPFGVLVYMEAGWHSLRVDYFDAGGAASCRLVWGTPSRPDVRTVEAEFLGHDEKLPESEPR